MGTEPARVIAGRGDHHGLHSRARWRHCAHGVRGQASRGRWADGHAAYRRASRPPRRSRCGVGAPADNGPRRSQNRHRALQFPPQRGRRGDRRAPLGLAVLTSYAEGDESCGLYGRCAGGRRGAASSGPKRAMLSLHGTDANVWAKVPLERYLREEPYLEALERAWGAAPGRQLTDGSQIFVLGGAVSATSL
jgi:hypothetical protein